MRCLEIKEKALDYLKQSLDRGLSDKKHIDSDKDLDSLREEKEFKNLMAKYFSGAVSLKNGLSFE